MPAPALLPAEPTPDERDDAEIGAAHEEREQRPHARRRQRGDDRDGVDVALVQDAQHDVDRDDRREDEQRLLRGLLREGRVREFAGRLERWPVAPLDDTAEAAAEMCRRLGLSC